MSVKSAVIPDYAFHIRIEEHIYSKMYPHSIHHYLSKLNIYGINQEMAIKQEHEISEYLEHMAYFLKNVQLTISHHILQKYIVVAIILQLFHQLPLCSVHRMILHKETVPAFGTSNRLLFQFLIILIIHL